MAPLGASSMTVVLELDVDPTAFLSSHSQAYAPWRGPLQPTVIQTNIEEREEKLNHVCH